MERARNIRFHRIQARSQQPSRHTSHRHEWALGRTHGTHMPRMRDRAAHSIRRHIERKTE